MKGHSLHYRPVDLSPKGNEPTRYARGWLLDFSNTFAIMALVYALTPCRMRKISIVATATLLLFSGCFSNQEGPNLFNDSEDLMIGETPTAPEPEVIAPPPVAFEDGDEFGTTVEGTQCTLQLHGGCVPFDYYRYEGIPLGLHFMYPSNWNVTSASEREVGITPVERTDDTDPTHLFVWRQTGVNATYEAIRTTLEDQGAASTGPYDVTWEIYTGTWQGSPVKSEWVWLIYDNDDRTTNYLFMLVTEPEHFDADQAVLKAAVSSVARETF